MHNLDITFCHHHQTLFFSKYKITATQVVKPKNQAKLLSSGFGCIFITLFFFLGLLFWCLVVWSGLVCIRHNISVLHSSALFSLSKTHKAFHGNFPGEFDSREKRRMQKLSTEFMKRSTRESGLAACITIRCTHIFIIIQSWERESVLLMWMWVPIFWLLLVFFLCWYHITSHKENKTKSKGIFYAMKYINIEGDHWEMELQCRYTLSWLLVRCTDVKVINAGSGYGYG